MRSEQEGRTGGGGMEDSLDILQVAFTSSQGRAPSLEGRWAAEALNL